MGLDPRLLDVFRAKIANPMNWRRVHHCLMSYSQWDLANPDGAGALVDNLSGVLGVPLTPAQRAGAVNWIVGQRINPRNPLHQMRMWSVVNGY
ncbi:MAG: hypothetical protein K6T78_02275 [Alicyclobacillus sp.]|nr:hypothetical protein [Alicyclobacillus sp.]